MGYSSKTILVELGAAMTPILAIQISKPLPHAMNICQLVEEPRAPSSQQPPTMGALPDMGNVKRWGERTGKFR